MTTHTPSHAGASATAPPPSPPPVLPEPGSIEDEADLFADGFEDSMAFIREFYQRRRRLEDWVRTNGPIRTRHGLVGIEPEGYTYDDLAIAEAFPALLTSIVATFEFTTIADFEQGLSLIQEQTPATKLGDVKRSIDKTSVARMIKAGGPAGEKVAGLRSPKGRLGVRK